MGRFSRRISRRQSSSDKTRLFQHTFIDPTPWIPKTGPEALIFAELVSRRIFFDFQILLTEAVPSARGLPVLNQKPYRADFLLPAQKVVIDPWDDFHHSDPAQARDDAEKLAVYQALGYHTYYFWSSDLLLHGAAWALDQIPELPARGKGGYKLYHPQDDSAGIVAANKSRRTFASPTLRRRRARGRRSP